MKSISRLAALVIAIVLLGAFSSCTTLFLNAAPRDPAVDGFGRQLGTIAFDVSGNAVARWRGRTWCAA